MNRNFMKLLERRWAQDRFVCVGLDVDPAKLPKCLHVEKHGEINACLKFNKEIIDATAECAVAYKPNRGFYEGLGYRGVDKTLEGTLEYIHKHYPHIPVIDDAKRGDIGNTNEGYVEGSFHHLKADAITIHPYLGEEANRPFLDQKNKGIFVLCRTSNSGAGEFQDLKVCYESGRIPLYEMVAHRVSEKWNHHHNCALVVGATFPAELKRVRSIVGNMPILIPGIGAQGGGVEAAVKAGLDSNQKGIIINSSRGIIYASSGDDFAEAARKETIKLHDEINKYRK